MAFDGTVVCGLVHELQAALTGTHIAKIAQPEKDALLIQTKGNKETRRLFLSASASLPLVYLTESNRPSPADAPNFCMLLRKHLQGARITGVSQPDFERIIRIHTEHLDELGDLRHKDLIIELMGKHSNIILVDENETVVDAIKRVSMLVSSVREVLPGRPYFVPKQEGRVNPLEATMEDIRTALEKPVTLTKALYQSFTGFSPVFAHDLADQAGLDGDQPTASLSETEKEKVCAVLTEKIRLLKEGTFRPVIYYDGEKPVEFSAFTMGIFPEMTEVPQVSFSSMLETYYGSRDALVRIHQRSTDLRKLVATALERTERKRSLQEKQLRDTDSRDKYRRYGELITTYGYQVEAGAKSMTAADFETGEEVTIPLDETLPVMANAKKYFDRYARLKRTAEAVTEQLAESEAEYEHLLSIKASLDNARTEADLMDIREELSASGYAKKHTEKGAKNQKAGKKERRRTKSAPMHFRSSDGFDLYVGKNNFQNDWLTFQFAHGNDWWFHTKKAAGSHVILVTEGKEVPDRAFEEAAKLAVHFSSANPRTEKNPDGDPGTRAEVDYVLKKEVKKPNNAKPGFVVYYTNYSMVSDADISALKEVSEG